MRGATYPAHYEVMSKYGISAADYIVDRSGYSAGLSGWNFRSRSTFRPRMSFAPLVLIMVAALQMIPRQMKRIIADNP